MGMISDWPSMAACQSGDPDALFVQGAEQNVAKRICRSCPVRYECLADALDNRIEFGVWGGMTERERRALLRRHPHVASWRKMFEAAMDRREPEPSWGARIFRRAAAPPSASTEEDHAHRWRSTNTW